MELWFKALCFCTVMGVPQPQVAHQSGDVWYTEEPLSRGGLLLRLSTSDSVIDHDDARLRRLQAFAESYAEAACRGRFELRPAGERYGVRPVYARQFVYRCR